MGTIICISKFSVMLKLWSRDHTLRISLRLKKGYPGAKDAFSFPASLELPSGEMDLGTKSGSVGKEEEEKRCQEENQQNHSVVGLGTVRT